MLGVELVGDWRLTRTVTDRRTGGVGSVAGALSITVDGNRLRWQENGTLTWAGATMPVTRTSYLGLLGGEPWMTFADGRAFHPWRPGVDVEHRCGPDLYVGRIDVAVPRMATVWHVTGPAKDQLLTTALLRR